MEKIVIKQRNNSQENTKATLKTNEKVTYAGACVGSLSSGVVSFR